MIIRAVNAFRMNFLTAAHKAVGAADDVGVVVFIFDIGFGGGFATGATIWRSSGGVLDVLIASVIAERDIMCHNPGLPV